MRRGWLPRPFFVALACVVCVGACAIQPRTGVQHSIVIDQPEVFTRERLLNQRLAEQEWLLKERGKEASSSMQAYRDVREFRGLFGNVQASFDPLQGDIDTETLKGRASEQADNSALRDIQREMDLMKARSQLDALRKLLAETPATPPTGTPGPAPSSDQVAQLQQQITSLEARIKTLESSSAGLKSLDVFRSATDSPTLPSTKDIDVTKAQLTSVEQFRDRMAYRNTVNAALREQELDDIHDQYGFTLYTLKFDISVKAGEAAEAVGLVTCTLGECKKPDSCRSCKGQPSAGKPNHACKECGGKKALDTANSTINPCPEPDSTLLTPWFEAFTKRLQAEAIAMQRRGLTCPIIFTDDDLLALSRANEKSVEAIIAAKQREIAAKRQLGTLAIDATADESKSQQPESIDIRQANPIQSKPLREAVNRMSLESVDIKQFEKDFETANFEIAKDVQIWFKENRSWNGCGEDFQKGNQLRDNYLYSIAWATWLRYSDALCGIVDCFQFQRVWIDGIDYVVPVPQIAMRHHDGHYDDTAARERFARARGEMDGPWVYTVEPKELAQNMSDVAAKETLLNFAASLGITLPQLAGANLKAYAESMRRSQHRLQSILRKPLVVGFADGKDKFGWMLGPRFKVDDDAKLGFGHTPVQHSVQVTIVVPGFADRLCITPHVSWIDDSGQTISEDAVSEPISVKLPADYDAITRHLLARFGPPSRAPIVDWKIALAPGSRSYYQLRQHEAVAGQPTSLVIPGFELWRNPEVFIGTTPATSIRVLPDMQAIAATFATLPEPTSIADGAGYAPMDVTVFTSGGHVTVPNAVRLLPGKKPASAPFISVFSNIAVKGHPFTVGVTPALIPSGFADVRLKGVTVSPLGGLTFEVAPKPVTALAPGITQLSWPALGAANAASLAFDPFDATPAQRKLPAGWILL